MVQRKRKGRLAGKQPCILVELKGRRGSPGGAGRRALPAKQLTRTGRLVAGCLHQRAMSGAEQILLAQPIPKGEFQEIVPAFLIFEENIR